MMVPADAPAPGPKLACRNLWKVYGSRPGHYFDAAGLVEPGAAADRMRAEGHIPAAADVSFDVAEGEIFVIMGLSGSGKSTVIRCLSRLVEPTSGAILLDGHDLLGASPRELIEIRRHKMGMVFQNFGLLPHLTALENVAFPLRTQGMALSQRNARARQVIELVGLAGREDAYPRQLSGGEQQRVGIARSLAVEPEVWFLDEPFGALDPLIRRQLQDEFLRLQKQLRKTIVFVTHDMLEAVRLGDRIAIMKDGAIVQIATPEEIVLHPANDYVARFTADVPVAKVLRVEGVMEPPRASPATGPSRPTITVGASLEAAIELLDDSHDTVNVADDTGRIVGLISAPRIIRFLGKKRNSGAMEAGE